MKSLDPIQLQRLVDGELELAEIQTMLARVESQDWKTIATRYIENQIFQSQFDEMELESDALAQRKDHDDVVSTSLPHLKLLSLAASTLLTLSIGMLIGASYFGGAVMVDSSTPVVDAGNTLVENRSNNSPAVYRMQLEDKEGNQFIDTDIPFYQAVDWTNVDQHGFKEYSTDIRNSVLNSGYDLQQQTRFLGGRLRDGRRFVIPIRNTKFAPYQ